MDISLKVKAYKGVLTKDGKETSFWTPGDVIRQVALDHCEYKRKDSPGMGIKCTWGSEVILSMAEPQTTKKPKPTPTPTAKATPKPKATPPPTPIPPAVVHDFSCALWSDSSGCKKTVQCPAGKTIKAIRAACHLETPDVTQKQVEETAWNKLRVVTPSDVVKDGTCSIKISGKTTSLSSGSASLSFTPARSMEIFCKEKDSNGGDCEIQGQIKCE